MNCETVMLRSSANATIWASMSESTRIVRTTESSLMYANHTIVYDNLRAEGASFEMSTLL